MSLPVRKRYICPRIKAGMSVLGEDTEKRGDFEKSRRDGTSIKLMIAGDRNARTTQTIIVDIVFLARSARASPSSLGYARSPRPARVFSCRGFDLC